VLRRTLSTLLPAKAVRDRALALGEDHSWPHELPRERVSPPPDEPTPQRPPRPESPSTLGSERAIAVVGQQSGSRLWAA
jgi:hypothetical protein